MTIGLGLADMYLMRCVNQEWFHIMNNSYILSNRINDYKIDANLTSKDCENETNIDAWLACSIQYEYIVLPTTHGYWELDIIMKTLYTINEEWNVDEC